MKSWFSRRASSCALAIVLVSVSVKFKCTTSTDDIIGRMRYRTFGGTGWKVSGIGFGAWAIGGGWGPQDESESVAALNRALDLGCNFIDTAQGYGNGRSER